MPNPEHQNMKAFFTLCLCAPLWVWGQDLTWFETGSSWIYNYQTVSGPEQFQAEFQISETVFAGKDCFKMEVIGDYPFLCTPFDAPIYLYASNDSVFLGMEVSGNFRLAYNFNAEVGDFWDYQLPISEVAVDFFRVHVIAVDNVMMDGNEVKEMVLTYQSMFTAPHVEIFPEEIIVRQFLGSTNGFFLPLGHLLACDAETSIALQCFNSPSINYSNPEFGSCFLSTQTVNDPESILIYPNPASDYINIKMAINTESRIRIFQLDGKLVFNQSMNSGSERINLPKLSSGMYIVEISDVESRFFRKVLVSQ